MADEKKSESTTDERIGTILQGIHPGFLPHIDRRKLMDVIDKIDKKGDKGNTEPPEHLIFEWLRYCGPEEIVGCIVGQDPYPNDAIGMCFAKRSSSGMPASFAPLVRCLENRGLMARGIGKRHADLRPWAVQGLLMPNMALTTKKGQSKIHMSDWESFVTKLLNDICAEIAKTRKIFFLLWGAEAKKLAPIAKKHGHETFHWTHPSPMSDNKLPDNKRFVNCTNFEDANKFLVAQGYPAFMWDNMAAVSAFVDGACSDNGAPTAKGGFGALVRGGHFGDTKVRGCVEAFTYALVDKSHPELGFQATEEKMVPTNNRAELLGICWGLLILARGFAFGPITMYSDSKVSVQTISEWLPKRIKEGTEHKLKNPDLLAIASALVGVIKSRAVSFKLEHIPASHDVKLSESATEKEKANWHGNDIADKLSKSVIPTDDRLEIESFVSFVRSLVSLVSAAF